MPALTNLPIAIRDRIWNLVFSESGDANSQVLRVSHQIYNETLPFMYRRPLTFESQDDLYTWIQRAGTSNLHHVDALSFSLVLSEHVGLTNGNHGQSSIVADEECARLRSTLQLMSNVTKLAVYKLPHDNRAEYTALYDTLLRSLNTCFPNLTDLTVHTDNHSLAFLLAQWKPSQRFPAFDILQTWDIIPSLRPAATQLLAWGSHSRPLGTSPCLTREVLRSLRPEGLSIRESLILNPSAPAFFNSTFLPALNAVRRHTLFRFEVVLENFAPDPQTTLLFCPFLESSHIRQLVIEWSSAVGIDSVVLRCLPRSLRALRLGKVSTPQDAIQLLSILEGRKLGGQLPNLQEITVERKQSASGRDYERRFGTPGSQGPTIEAGNEGILGLKSALSQHLGLVLRITI
ncbi:hypothetical protein BT63DRAFT_475973 [Microthyrium microscopicum]|uniref:Uncharacterized protein n=1 Tax=Microthyrium microscopicum TaxID=703497 RepID=A0A6A6UMF0_9PEZI|nr:hypothetical protein BT63DRAFT_475973 [Microthyrium microscopicum]